MRGTDFGVPKTVSCILSRRPSVFAFYALSIGIFGLVGIPNSTLFRLVLVINVEFCR